jgi:hypothetical protein
MKVADYHRHMATTIPSPIILHADPEHERLRSVVIFIILLTVLAGYWLTRWLFDLAGITSDFIIMFSCFGSLPIGLALAWLIEAGLKRIWHSGNSVTLNADGVTLQTVYDDNQTVQWHDTVLTTNWCFPLAGYARGGRERRLPRNWVCLSSQLRQEDQRIIVYTYIPARKAAPLTDQIMFNEIKPAEVYNTTLRDRFALPRRPDIPAKIISGKDGEFWLAERRRWKEGVELTAKDFATYLHYLSANSSQ